jgi:hypothetical protein
MAAPKKAAPRKRAPAKPKAKAEAPPPMGDNNPPEPLDDSPFAIMSRTIDDLWIEAENWLDKEPIANEAQAEQVTRLKGLFDEASKTAEAERKREKQPHLDAGRAVDEKWKPLVDRAEKAKKTAANKLTPWLQAIEAEKHRLAMQARREAEEAAARLREAHERQQESDDISDMVPEDLEQEAEEARKRAAILARDKAEIRTDEGKASMRTYWFVNVQDPKLLLQHYMRTDPDWLRGVIRERAEAEVRKGARDLPGCSIWSEKRAI